MCLYIYRNYTEYVFILSIDSGNINKKKIWVSTNIQYRVSCHFVPLITATIGTPARLSHWVPSLSVTIMNGQ